MLGCDKVCGTVKDLQRQVGNLTGQLRRMEERFAPQYMMLISLKGQRYVVPCERCYKAGRVQRLCTQCGGKGVHYKGTQRWEVLSRPVEITQITDRPGEGLRYWTDMSSFFSDDSNLLFHDTVSAQAECDRRNKELANAEIQAWGVRLKGGIE